MAAAPNDPSKVPVTVLTGFLGSGKTTLLNHILTATHGKKIAVIENEFGEVGIDDALLAQNTKLQTDEDIFEMMNGCICCTVRTDLIAVLQKLAKRTRAGELKLDGIIIETTGMADPSPVAQTFFVDYSVKEFARLDGIVTLVDAKHIEQHLDEEKPAGVTHEAVEQVAFADKMLLNKTDLVTEEDLARVEGRLRAINNFAPIERCNHSNVDVASVLHINGFDLARTLRADPQFLATAGLFFDAAKQQQQQNHDRRVTSFGIREERPVSLDLVQEWMSNTLLPKKGKQLYRMKGVLAVAGHDCRFVYQAVHMINVGGFAEPWGDDEPRVSKLTFIGKELDKEELAQGFEGCIDTPENVQALLDRAGLGSLRFEVRDRVRCCVGSQWVAGAVVKLAHWTGRAICPYQVKLDDGKLVYAPHDQEQFIQWGGDGPAPERVTAAKPAPPPPDGMAAWSKFMVKG